MARSKFNMGDKLKVVRAAYRLTEQDINNGAIVTVTGVDVYSGYDTRVAVNGCNNNGLGYDDSRFELVASAPTIKVGSKVRIVNSDSPDRDPDGMGLDEKWHNCWIPSMKAKVGNGVIYTVSSITPNGVHLEETGSGYPLTAFELVDDSNGVDGNGNPVRFTEADLKQGMRVVTNHGASAIVFGEFKTGGYDCVAVCYSNSGWDEANVVGFKEVYEAPAHPNDFLKPTARGKLLFKAVDVAAIAAADKAVKEAKEALEKAEAARKALN